jgi:hypothetical protein
MAVYDSNPNMQPDSEFIPGSLAYLVEGNVCRALDGRRTPGFIEEVFHDEAMFRWRITDFEHNGKFWDLPVEYAERYQFAQGSKKLGDQQMSKLKDKSNSFDEELVIEPDEKIGNHTRAEIASTELEIEKWLNSHSLFLKTGESLDFKQRTSSPALWNDLIAYFESQDLAALEERTAENYVLNPYSGEWIKGMQIVLAEMGLVAYRNKQPRTSDIFSGQGSKENRRRYLIHRLAFVRAFFRLQGFENVVLYRGMSTESSLQLIERTFISCSFSLRVARSFSHFERDERFRNSLLAKLVVSVDRLWMTFFETKQMNNQYKEAEAIVLASDGDPALW